MDTERTLMTKTARYLLMPHVKRPRADRIRQRLILLLGFVWLLDAALQFQPFMFTGSFVTRIIEPAAGGNPGIVAAPLLWAAHLMLHHIALFNAIFATTQLLIAVGLLVPRTRKLALAGSVGYALSVWWLGEGLGGIFTGASPLAGFPGGVVLYAVIAILLWPATARDRGELTVPAARGRFGARGAGLFWAALWGSFACYLLLPANRGARALAQIFTTSASDEPGWLRSVEGAAANLIGSHGTLVSVLLALACAFAALGIFKPSVMKPAVLVAAAFALVIWVAEAFGGILTGTGTDPNTGLLLVLLAACYWPYRTGVLRCPRPVVAVAGLDFEEAYRRHRAGLEGLEGPVTSRELVPVGQGRPTTARESRHNRTGPRGGPVE